jgi:signal transduction histidine kinase
MNQGSEVDQAGRVDALLQRIAELTEAVAARDSFIAFAAHELRNPMTPIMGQIELLLAGIRSGRGTPEKIEERLVRLQQAVRRYLKRATILLNVSRITSGKFPLEPEKFDLGVLLRDLVRDFAEAAHHAGVTITLEAPDSLQGTWDRLAVEQIVDNLLSNAIKYGGRTPIELSAEAACETVRLQVRDHGAGIPLADRERVFQRFERVAGGADQGSSFGVGLWVVGQLADAMGGSVTAGDAAGGGALFTVTLPRCPKEARP